MPKLSLHWKRVNLERASQNFPLRSSNPKAKTLFIASGGLLIGWFLLAWLGARFLLVTAPIEHADAIVLLSGSSTYVERAALAARLFREGKAPLIILTNDNRQGGWSNAEQRNPFYYERTRWELRRAGVPESQIHVILEPVSGTFDEAARLFRYCRDHNLRSIMIVTSGYHSRRALQTFRRAFADSDVVIGMASVPPGTQTPYPSTWWFRPHGWQLVAGEYLKLLVYESYSS